MRHTYMGTNPSPPPDPDPLDPDPDDGNGDDGNGDTGRVHNPPHQ